MNGRSIAALAVPTEGEPAEPRATQAHLEGLIGQLDAALEAADYFHPPDRTPATRNTIRTILTKAGWSTREVQALRGIVRALGGAGRASRADRLTFRPVIGYISSAGCCDWRRSCIYAPLPPPSPCRRSDRRPGRRNAPTSQARDKRICEVDVPMGSRLERHPPLPERARSTKQHKRRRGTSSTGSSDEADLCPPNC